ncbi:hypothetical protein GOB57_21590 [Sinorhizobium meliloti]|nr:hypothetical protein [Sinorhizobium meliloti]
MKRKTPAVPKPQSVVEQIQEKLDAIASEREEVFTTLTAKLAELDAQVAAFETVIKTYDPSYVPLEIRRVQAAAPTLTPAAQPVLAEIAASAEAAAKKKEPAGPSETATEAAAPAAVRKSGKKSASGPKADTAHDVDPKAAAAAEKAKRKAREHTKKQKRLDDARIQMREYFGDIDKLDTLEEIIRSSQDGIPFREISNAFAVRHPIDLSKAEVKKVYSDRLSALLSYMAKQGSVARSEREGPEGPEKVWIWTRDEKSGNGSGDTQQATAEASAAV